MPTSSRRVLLIDPPLYKHPLWDPIRTSQPLGIWSIGSYLQDHGHRVRLVFAPLQGLDNVELITGAERAPRRGFVSERVGLLEAYSSDQLIDKWSADEGSQTPSYLRVGLSEEAILAEIEQFQPDLVGIASIASCLHQSAVDLARAIRVRCPDLPIAAGGQHATAMTEDLLRDGEGAIDFVVAGEGEHAMRSVVELLPDRAKIRELSGIAYLDGGVMVKNGRTKKIDLATVSPLNPSLVEHVELPHLPLHTYGSAQMRSTRTKYTDMMFSVGCHRACPYCFSPVMRGRLRTMSWDQIDEQLRLLREHGYEELVLQDDDLLKDAEFFVEILRRIKKAGLRWQDNGGMELELLSDELMTEIIASGCTSIYIPMNPRQLADRLPTEQALAKVHLLQRLKDAGVYTFTSGIYGVPDLVHPENTYEDLRRLREFHVELVADGFVNASLVFPLSTLPGTRWFREVERSDSFTFDRSDWLGYSIFVPQVYPKALGQRVLCREILETHRVLNEFQGSYPWFSPFPNRLSS